MKRSFTSDIAPHDPNTEHGTPTKAKLQGAVKYAKYLTGNNLIHTKQRAFDFFKMPRRSGQHILAQIGIEDSDQEAADPARCSANNPKIEYRGKQWKIQQSYMQRIEEIVNSGNINHCSLAW